MIVSAQPGRGDRELRIGALCIASPLILAPMRRVTTVAYRRLYREHGAALTVAQCVRATLLLRRVTEGRATRLLDRHPGENPVGFQLSANDAESAAEAVRHVIHHGYDLVDLNFGCPPRENAETEGAELMREPGRIARIVAAAANAAGRVPVTVKIRSGADPEHRNAIDVAKVAEQAGAVAVTVHGRTGTGGYSGAADWRVIADVKQAVSIPVIGNGDVWRPEDAVKMLRRTGCDFVMIARGAYGNPWLFERTNEALRTGSVPPEPSWEGRVRTYRRYLELCAESGDWPHGAIDAAYRYAAVVERFNQRDWGDRASPLAQTRWGRTLLYARDFLTSGRLAGIR